MSVLDNIFEDTLTDEVTHLRVATANRGRTRCAAGVFAVLWMLVLPRQGSQGGLVRIRSGVSGYRDRLRYGPAVWGRRLVLPGMVGSVCRSRSATLRSVVSDTWRGQPSSRQIPRP